MSYSTRHHLVLGGARSGKSRFAETLALESNSKPILIATAEAGDAEMQLRIVQHQSNRSSAWQLIEQPIAIGETISTISEQRLIVIDCLTLWLSNCMHRQLWLEQKAEFLDTLQSTPHTLIMVSNEVGLGIVPTGEVSRRFVDEIGWLHQELAALCASVTQLIAGLPQKLK